MCKLLVPGRGQKRTLGEGEGDHCPSAQTCLPLPPWGPLHCPPRRSFRLSHAHVHGTSEGWGERGGGGGLDRAPVATVSKTTAHTSSPEDEDELDSFSRSGAAVFRRFAGRAERCVRGFRFRPFRRDFPEKSRQPRASILRLGTVV